MTKLKFKRDNEIWSGANSSESWAPGQGGLKLRVPGQFKEMKSETKTLPCCFWRYFPEAEVKNCCSSTCQSVCDSQASDLPSSLNSVRVSKAGTCMFQGCTKAHCTLQLSPPVNAFSKSLNIRGGVVVPLSQSQIHACVPPSNFSKQCCQWHKQVLAGEHMESERGGEEWRIYSEITKHFFKAPLLLCNNLLLLFFFLLQINSRERLKTPQLTMRGGRKIPAAG